MSNSNALYIDLADITKNAPKDVPIVLEIDSNFAESTVFKLNFTPFELQQSGYDGSIEYKPNSIEDPWTRSIDLHAQGTTPSSGTVDLGSITGPFSREDAGIYELYQLSGEKSITQKLVWSKELYITGYTQKRYLSTDSFCELTFNQRNLGDSKRSTAIRVLQRRCIPQSLPLEILRRFNAEIETFNEKLKLQLEILAPETLRPKDAKFFLFSSGNSLQDFHRSNLFIDATKDEFQADPRLSKLLHEAIEFLFGTHSSRGVTFQPEISSFKGKDGFNTWDQVLGYIDSLPVASNIDGFYTRAVLIYNIFTDLYLEKSLEFSSDDNSPAEFSVYDGRVLRYSGDGQISLQVDSSSALAPGVYAFQVRNSTLGWTTLCAYDVIVIPRANKIGTRVTEQNLKTLDKILPKTDIFSESFGTPLTIRAKLASISISTSSTPSDIVSSLNINEQRRHGDGSIALTRSFKSTPASSATISNIPSPEMSLSRMFMSPMTEDQSSAYFFGETSLGVVDKKVFLDCLFLDGLDRKLVPLARNSLFLDSLIPIGDDFGSAQQMIGAFQEGFDISVSSLVNIPTIKFTLGDVPVLNESTDVGSLSRSARDAYSKQTDGHLEFDINISGMTKKSISGYKLQVGISNFASGQYLTGKDWDKRALPEPSVMGSEIILPNSGWFARLAKYLKRNTIPDLGVFSTIDGYQIFEIEFSTANLKKRNAEISIDVSWVRNPTNERPVKGKGKRGTDNTLPRKIQFAGGSASFIKDMTNYDESTRDGAVYRKGTTIFVSLTKTRAAGNPFMWTEFMIVGPPVTHAESIEYLDKTIPPSGSRIYVYFGKNDTYQKRTQIQWYLEDYPSSAGKLESTAKRRAKLTAKFLNLRSAISSDIAKISGFSKIMGRIGNELELLRDASVNAEEEYLRKTRELKKSINDGTFQSNPENQKFTQKQFIELMDSFWKELETSVKNFEDYYDQSKAEIDGYLEAYKEISPKQEEYERRKTELQEKFDSILITYPGLPEEICRTYFSELLEKYYPLSIPKDTDSLEKFKATSNVYGNAIDVQKNVIKALDTLEKFAGFYVAQVKQISDAIDSANNDENIKRFQEVLKDLPYGINGLEAATASFLAVLDKSNRVLRTINGRLQTFLKKFSTLDFGGMYQSLTKISNPDVGLIVDPLNAEHQKYFDFLKKFVDNTQNDLASFVTKIETDVADIETSIQAAALELGEDTRGEGYSRNIKKSIGELRTKLRNPNSPIKDLKQLRTDIEDQVQKLTATRQKIEEEVRVLAGAKTLKADRERISKEHNIQNIRNRIADLKVFLDEYQNKPLDIERFADVSQEYLKVFKTVNDELQKSYQDYNEKKDAFKKSLDEANKMYSGKSYTLGGKDHPEEISDKLDDLDTLSSDEVKQVLDWFLADDMKSEVVKTYEEFEIARTNHESKSKNLQQEIDQARKRIKTQVVRFKDFVSKLYQVENEYVPLQAEIIRVAERAKELENSPVADAKVLLKIEIPAQTLMISNKLAEIAALARGRAENWGDKTFENFKIARDLSSDSNPAEFGTLSPDEKIAILEGASFELEMELLLYVDWVKEIGQEVYKLRDRVEQLYKDNESFEKFSKTTPGDKSPIIPPETTVKPASPIRMVKIPSAITTTTTMVDEDKELKEELAYFVASISRYFLGLKPKRILEVSIVEYSPVQVQVESSVRSTREGTSLLDVSKYFPQEYLRNQDGRYSIYWDIPENARILNSGEINDGKTTRLVIDTTSPSGDSSVIYSCSLIDNDPTSNGNNANQFGASNSLIAGEISSDSIDLTDREYKMRSVFLPGTHIIALSHFDSYQWIESLKYAGEKQPLQQSGFVSLANNAKLLSTINFEVELRDPLDGIDFEMIVKYLLEFPAQVPNTLEMLEFIHLGYPFKKDVVTSGKYGQELFDHIGARNVRNAIYKVPSLRADIAERFLVDIIQRDYPDSFTQFPMLPFYSQQIVEQIIDVMKNDKNGNDLTGQRLLYKNTFNVIRSHLGLTTDINDPNWIPGSKILESQLKGAEDMAKIIAIDIGIRRLLPVLMSDHLSWGLENGYPGNVDWEKITFWQYVDLKPALKAEAKRRGTTVAEMPFSQVLLLIQSYGSGVRQLNFDRLAKEMAKYEFKTKSENFDNFTRLRLPTYLRGSRKAMSKQNLLQLLQDQRVLGRDVSYEDVDRLYDAYSFESNIDSHPRLIGSEFVYDEQVSDFLEDKGRSDLLVFANPYYATTPQVNFAGTSENTIPESVISDYFGRGSEESRNKSNGLANLFAQKFYDSGDIEKQDSNDAWIFSTLSQRFQRFVELLRNAVPDLKNYRDRVSVLGLAEDIKRFHTKYGRSLEEEDLKLLKNFWFVRKPARITHPVFGFGAPVPKPPTVPLQSGITSFDNFPLPTNTSNSTFTVVTPSTFTRPFSSRGSTATAKQQPLKIVQGFSERINRILEDSFGDKTSSYRASFPDILRTKPPTDGAVKYVIDNVDFGPKLGNPDGNIVLRTLIPYLSDASTASVSMKSSILDTISDTEQSIGPSNIVDQILNALQVSSIEWKRQRSYTPAPPGKYALAVLSDPDNTSLQLSDADLSAYDKFFQRLEDIVDEQARDTKTQISDIVNSIAKYYLVHPKPGEPLETMADFEQMIADVKIPNLRTLIDKAINARTQFTEATKQAHIAERIGFVFDRQKVIDYLTADKNLEQFEKTFSNSLKEIDKILNNHKKIALTHDFDSDGLTKMIETLDKHIEILLEIPRMVSSNFPQIVDDLQQKIANFLADTDVIGSLESKMSNDLKDTIKLYQQNFVDPDELSDKIRKANQLFKTLKDDISKSWDYSFVLMDPEKKFEDIEKGNYVAYIIQEFLDQNISAYSAQFVKSASGYYQKLLNVVRSYKNSLSNSLNAIFRAFSDSGFRLSYPNSLWFNPDSSQDLLLQQVSETVAYWNRFITVLELMAWPYRLLETPFSDSETFQVVTTTGAYNNAQIVSEMIKELYAIYSAKISFIRSLPGIQLRSISPAENFQDKLTDLADRIQNQFTEPGEFKIIKDSSRELIDSTLEQYSFFFTSYASYGVPLKDAGLSNNFPTLENISLKGKTNYELLYSFGRIFSAYEDFSEAKRSNSIADIPGSIKDQYEKIISRHATMFRDAVTIMET